MAIKTSGLLKFSDIEAEFQQGTNPIKLSEYYRGGANVPDGPVANNNIAKSGLQKLSNYYGAEKTTPQIEFAPTSLGTQLHTGFMSDSYRAATRQPMANFVWQTAYNNWKAAQDPPIQKFRQQAAIIPGDQLNDANWIKAFLSSEALLDLQIDPAVFPNLEFRVNYRGFTPANPAQEYVRIERLGAGGFAAAGLSTTMKNNVDNYDLASSTWKANKATGAPIVNTGQWIPRAEGGPGKPPGDRAIDWVSNHNSSGQTPDVFQAARSTRTSDFNIMSFAENLDWDNPMAGSFVFWRWPNMAGEPQPLVLNQWYDMTEGLMLNLPNNTERTRWGHQRNWVVLGGSLATGFTATVHQFPYNRNAGWSSCVDIEFRVKGSTAVTRVEHVYKIESWSAVRRPTSRGVYNVTWGATTDGKASPHALGWNYFEYPTASATLVDPGIWAPYESWVDGDDMTFHFISQGGTPLGSLFLGTFMQDIDGKGFGYKNPVTGEQFIIPLGINMLNNPDPRFQTPPRPYLEYAEAHTITNKGAYHTAVSVKITKAQALAAVSPDAAETAAVNAFFANPAAFTQCIIEG